MPARRGRTPDPAARFAPLRPGELDIEGEYVVGIARLGDPALPHAAGIVAVSMATQRLPAEQLQAGAVPQKYVLARRFSPACDELGTRVAVFSEPAYARPDHARLEREGDALVLHTFAVLSPFETDPASVLAKRVAITANGPSVLGEAPQPAPLVFSDTREYPFASGTLRMASEFVMERLDAAGEQHWRLKLSAHLYTEIEFVQGRAYFGTAGNGGRLHCIDPVTGVELFSVQTGGTISYTWWGAGRIVLIDHRKTTAVLVIDAGTGAELARVSLGRHTVSQSASHLLDDGLFFTTAFAPETRSQHLLRVDLREALARGSGEEEEA